MLLLFSFVYQYICHFSAFLKFLFFTFETPYLKIFGMLSIPLFISFLPIEEFSALDPISRPTFARFSPIPLPHCLRFIFIFQKAGAAKLSRILLLFFLGPIFLVAFTLGWLFSTNFLVSCNESISI